MTAHSTPVVWSIAGSDSGAGAGLQADLRAFDAFELHGCTAVAAITAQNSVAVQAIEPVATALLDRQLAALAGDLPPQAVKTGLLGSVDNLRCVGSWIDQLRRERPTPLVVDPVWRASTGAELGSASLRDALRAELLPRASVVTPNRAEAAWLLGWDAAALDEPSAAAEAAAALRALGPQAVAITGGDARASAAQAWALDWIDTPEACGWLSLPRVATAHHHGSGCVFASSVAAALALGFCSADAIVLAKMATTDGLRQARPGGRGAGPVRPRSGFALQPGGLPGWALQPPESAASPAFAPLSDPQLGLYAVVDSAEWVERVLAAGVRTVQLRIKDGTPLQWSDAVRRSGAAARRHQAQLFINDHWALAIEHGAYGVHLGQEDLMRLAPADIGALRGAGIRLGLSSHSFWEVCRAQALAPSYIACGPIHATTTKAMPWLPQGNGNLAYWCRVIDRPVVAIAGMDTVRSQQALRCGAAGVAVLRGICQAEQPEAAIAALQRAIDEARGQPALAPPALPRSTLPPAMKGRAQGGSAG